MPDAAGICKCPALQGPVHMHMYIHCGLGLGLHTPDSGLRKTLRGPRAYTHVGRTDIAWPYGDDKFGDGSSK